MSTAAMSSDRLRRALLLLPILICGYLALLIGPQLPAIYGARAQLRQVLHRQDVRIVELYSHGRTCGLYSTADDGRPMRFLIEGRRVWTGAAAPEGVRRNVASNSSDPQDRWSQCVSDNRSRRDDAGLAIRILDRLHL